MSLTVTQFPDDCENSSIFSCRVLLLYIPYCSGAFKLEIWVRLTFAVL